MSADSVRFIDNRPLLYEGSEKILFDGSQYNTSFLHFKDSIKLSSAATYEVKDKGIINNALSSYIFEKLNIYGFQTHYILKQNSREQLIQNLEMISCTINVFNVAPSHIMKAMGLSEGVFLPTPIIEYYIKPHDTPTQQLVTPELLEVFGLASSEEVKEIRKISLDVNMFLVGFFAALGLQLNDVKLEFGRRYNELLDDTEILLADEISLDTCHLVDMVDEAKVGYASLSDCPESNAAGYQKFIEKCPFSLLRTEAKPTTSKSQIIPILSKKQS